jgi:hypothetical protein
MDATESAGLACPELTSHIIVAWRFLVAWQVQHAKAHFTEFLNQTLKKAREW